MFFRCKLCLTPNTRPRVIFNSELICNACLYFNKKKKIDWNKRIRKLKLICDRFRSNNGSFDVIVPVGGGKDSSYVAWTLKNRFKMNPLCVSAIPPLFTKLGRENLDNFSKSGFTLLEINNNNKAIRKIAKNGFIKYGQPQIDWLYSIKTIPINIALKFNIPLIMYGEEAETEYGGAKDLENKFSFDRNHIHKYYNSGIGLEKLINIKKNLKDLNFAKIPKPNQFKKIFLTKWSFFEKWDELKHLKLAINKCGLQKEKKNTPGSYNNFSHTDQKIYHLHMYLAYLKFGFGRATTDASIDIRLGRITRDKGLKLVKKYDHLFPDEYIKEYCDYFNMSQSDIINTCEKFRNKKIFKKINKRFLLCDKELNNF